MTKDEAVKYALKSTSKLQDTACDLLYALSQIDQSSISPENAEMLKTIHEMASSLHTGLLLLDGDIDDLFGAE